MPRNLDSEDLTVGDLAGLSQGEMAVAIEKSKRRLFLRDKMLEECEREAANIYLK